MNKSRWSIDDAVARGSEYDTKWQRLAAAGKSIHGEADFIMNYKPNSVLDAGCGTGRVAIELATRGVDVVGVDLDQSMLDEARRKAPELEWWHCDLASVDLKRRFDVVAMAGNVMIFVLPGTESQVISNMARHLTPDGLLVTGFQLDTPYSVDQYNRDCQACGLERVDRFATWEHDPSDSDDDYVVVVHQRTNSLS